MATIHPVAVAVAVAASLVVAMPCDVCVPTWVPGLDPRHICWWPGRGTCETWELRNRHWWNQIEDHTQDKYWNTLTCSPALNSIVTLAPDCRRLQKRDFLVCLTRQIKKKTPQRLACFSATSLWSKRSFKVWISSCACCSSSEIGPALNRFKNWDNQQSYGKLFQTQSDTGRNIPNVWKTCDRHLRSDGQNTTNALGDYLRSHSHLWTKIAVMKLHKTK